MGVYIKNMEMPKAGNWKTIRIYYDGTCAEPNWQGDCTLIKGAEAIPLPNHGDLIDRYSYKADLGITDWDCNKCQWGGVFGCKRDDFNDACFFLENAEVIIPAERSEE